MTNDSRKPYIIDREDDVYRLRLRFYAGVYARLTLTEGATNRSSVALITWGDLHDLVTRTDEVWVWEQTDAYRAQMGAEHYISVTVLPANPDLGLPAPALLFLVEEWQVPGEGASGHAVFVHEFVEYMEESLRHR